MSGESETSPSEDVGSLSGPDFAVLLNLGEGSIIIANKRLDVMRRTHFKCIL